MSLSVILRCEFPRVAAAIALIGWSLAGHISHAASGPEAAGKVDRLLDASGMAHTVRQILPGMLEGINSPQPGVPANVRGALSDAATQAFQPGPMMEKVRARMGSALNDRQIGDTLGWLDSPLGSRITAAENEASEPAALGRIEAYAKELERRPPAKQRANLIGELNRATGSGELTASMLEAGVLASALGVNAAQPAQQRVPGDVLQKQVKASLPHLRQQAGQMVTLGLHYSYRAFTDKEIESYLNFLKSPSGVAYSKAAVSAFRDAMLDAMGRFMQAIPKALDRHKGMTGA